jgi:glycosyltransferase involved in cell wall biosynthesis
MVVGQQATGGWKPKVAVIIPAWNAERHIGDAVASLIAQRDAAALDIIVVDDGSIDSTRDIVRTLAEYAPEVRLVTRPHSGISVTRNAGLDALPGDVDLVTFLDADDLSPPDRFARDIMKFRPDADVHWGMTRRFYDEGATRPASVAPDKDERGSQLAGLLVRPALLKAVGRFDEMLPMAEELDFLLRLLELQPRLQLTSDVAVLYRLHTTNVTRDRAGMREALTRAYLLAANRRRRGSPAIPAGSFTYPAAELPEPS